MNPRADRDAVLFLSKRERNGNRLLHKLFRNSGNRLEQREQIPSLPLKVCSRSWEQIPPKTTPFPQPEKMNLFPNLGTDQKGRKAAKQSRPFALFVLLRSAGERWISSPLLYLPISLKIKRIHHAHSRDIAECLGFNGPDKM